MQLLKLFFILSNNARLKKLLQNTLNYNIAMNFYMKVAIPNIKTITTAYQFKHALMMKVPILKTMARIQLCSPFVEKLKTKIYLYLHEVWKYSVTKNGSF